MSRDRMYMLPGVHEFDDPPCEVCGRDPADCGCPVCPICGVQGNPGCYRPGKHEPVTDVQREVQRSTNQEET